MTEVNQTSGETPRHRDRACGAREVIPLPDASNDCVIANGIFNLSPEKVRVAAEIARLLRLGGRFVAAEIVLTGDVPQEERATLDAWFR